MRYETSIISSKTHRHKKVRDYKSNRGKVKKFFLVFYDFLGFFGLAVLRKPNKLENSVQVIQREVLSLNSPLVTPGINTDLCAQLFSQARF